MTLKKYFILSLVLVITATAIITLGDYWSVQRATLLQSETYAERTAVHISHHLFLEEDPGRLDDLQWFKDHGESIRNLANSFGLLNIKIFNCYAVTS